MPWILETASGKFIDSFTGRDEAETARKKCGILGAKVKAGKAPLSRVLTAALATGGSTKLSRVLATSVGAVSIEEDFKSLANFVQYVLSKGRSQYTKDEFTTLAHYQGTSNLVDLAKKLQKLGLTPMIETSKMTAGGILTKKPAPPPKTVEHVRGKPVEVSGSFKPLPVSMEEKAKIRARSVPDVDFTVLLEKAPRGSMGKLDKTQASNQKLMVQGLRNLHRKIALTVEQYNAKIDEINEIIEQLENEKFAAVEEAVVAYNAGLESVSELLDQWIVSGEEYAQNLSDREPKNDPDALDRWTAEVDAHEVWLDQIRTVVDQLEGIDEETVKPVEVPEPIDENEYKIPDDFIPPEENADLIASIREEPDVRPLSPSERKKLQGAAKKI